MLVIFHVDNFINKEEEGCFGSNSWDEVEKFLGRLLKLRESMDCDVVEYWKNIHRFPHRKGAAR